MSVTAQGKFFRQVICPTCLAPIGEGCVVPGTDKRSHGVHRSRKTLAKQKLTVDGDMRTARLLDTPQEARTCTSETKPTEPTESLENLAERPAQPAEEVSETPEPVAETTEPVAETTEPVEPIEVETNIDVEATVENNADTTSDAAPTRENKIDKLNLPKLAYLLACPKCYAMPGAECRTKTGQTARGTHKERSAVLMDVYEAGLDDGFHLDSYLDGYADGKALRESRMP